MSDNVPEDYSQPRYPAYNGYGQPQEGPNPFQQFLSPIGGGFFDFLFQNPRSGYPYSRPQQNTYTTPPQYQQKLGDVAATMYGQAPNTNMANQMASAGFANRYGGQAAVPQSNEAAYQGLMNRQQEAYNQQPTSVPITSGGK